mmetsp:Transcript_26590/g.48252  ORF Transcript_26590/g.48252 Transcript_26590/m.48252 type:complete len:366 (-) Transcript_26590:152-1249(-)
MYGQNTGPSLKVGQVYSNFTVKTSGTKKGCIKNIHAIGGCNSDDSRVSIETVHLHQNLIDGLFSLIITSSKTCTTLPSDGINLINENNAGRILLRLRKDITNTRGTHTHKHLHKFRTRNRDKWHTGLSGHSLGQERFTGSGGSVEDDTAGNAASVLGIGLGLFEKVNDFDQFQFGTITSSHIFKGDTGIGSHLNFRLTLAKTHGVALSASRHASSSLIGISRQKEETRKEDRRENEALCQVSQSTRLCHRQDRHINFVVGELGEEFRVVGEGFDLEAGSVHVDSQELRAVGREGHLFDTVLVDEREKLAVPHVLRCTTTGQHHGRCIFCRRRHIHGHLQGRRHGTGRHTSMRRRKGTGASHQETP